MAEKKSLVEEALLQMKSLENVVAENAKGILHSTMREEIGQLVKESLGTNEDEDESMDFASKKSFDEQEEEDEDDEVEVDADDSEDETDVDTDLEDDDMDMDSEDDEMGMDDMDMDSEDDEMGMDSEDEEPIDLTNASDEEILKVFKGMGEEDGIIVKKDGNTIDLKDNDEEYKIRLGESEDDESYGEMEEDFDMGFESEEDGFGGFDEIDISGDDTHFGMDHMGHEDDEDEIVFEIEMGDSNHEGEQFESYEETDEDWNEGDMPVEEGFKPKGMGMGKPSKFKYKKSNGGFKEDMKQGTKGVGMGKPKFEYKKGENMLGKGKIVKKAETKEASRTLGSGRKFGRNGLPKPKAAPRHLEVESVNNELTLLRAKNEEYRKALNVFRYKLNEVAIFNSNLAYATRLFTEQSTTKQEKINILRRFDSVESLKESKSLYKTMKDELSSQNKNVVKESLQEKIEKTPTSGSAVNLIESKTYENPQFMRMKDLMSKMNIIK